MYHGDSVWQLLFVIGIVFTNAKKILFQSCAGKTYKGVQLVFHHSAFKFSLLYILCVVLRLNKPKQYIYIDDYDFE